MMNYKETLFFVGKCLTISHEEHNRIIVENEIKSGNVNWDNVVKLSTEHYVFPALYCNFKRANFLHYLPEELVNYMKHITDLNRERNLQIIEQAKEINELLLAHNITPIFLKGTGNLLEGLYEDIAERMVGDIDFLVSKEDFTTTVKILKNEGYTSKEKIDNTIFNRHYPKIIKENKISSVEIHYKMVINEMFFNFNYVIENVKKLNNTITVLSSKDQFLLTAYNKQINDKGQWYKMISLRNSYDLFLISKLISVIETLKKFKNSETKYLNNFIASCSLIFNEPKSLDYIKTKETNSFLNNQIAIINNPKKASFNKKKWDKYFLYKSRATIIFKSIYIKEYRIWLFKRLIRGRQN